MLKIFYWFFAFIIIFAFIFFWYLFFYKTPLYKTGEMYWKNEIGNLKSDPYGFEIFMLGWGFKEFDNLARWNRESVPFSAIVKTLPDTNLGVKLQFIAPNKMPFVNTERYVDVTDCKKYNSFISVPKFNKTYGGILLDSFIHINDILISYCLNTECTKIGRICKLNSYR